jgi:hypothetical protein
MPYIPSHEVIDYLLYQYQDLRREVELLQPRAGGMGMVPPIGTIPKSPVEAIAIERAEMSMVLDAVERGRKALSPDLRQIAKYRYRDKMAVHEIASRIHWSQPTVTRRLNTVRAVVAGYLVLVPESILIRYLDRIAGFMDAKLKQPPYNEGGNDCPKKT